ncbi:hypothetical protein T4C_6702 [Trichinella pseudospiralis]|uniref:Uncharacterized protein n=1 Tax=Trichinella pseudospiralis TaxID=6337 RepID=A0A0V1JW30_TRIPS|nr:hypothetical protein T4C_6702 [Trichinella pseudospiralis]
MNSLSSGERNEKSPYTKVSEQCCSSTVAGGRFGPIMNNLLCMVPRRFVESGCLRPQPKAGAKRCSASEPTISSYVIDTDNHGELTTRREDRCAELMAAGS